MMNREWSNALAVFRQTPYIIWRQVCYWCNTRLLWRGSSLYLSRNRAAFCETISWILNFTNIFTHSAMRVTLPIEIRPVVSYPKDTTGILEVCKFKLFLLHYALAAWSPRLRKHSTFWWEPWKTKHFCSVLLTQISQWLVDTSIEKMDQGGAH